MIDRDDIGALPVRCPDCGSYEPCRCRPPEKPRAAGKGKWDYECPGDHRCTCNNENN